MDFRPEFFLTLAALCLGVYVVAALVAGLRAMARFASDGESGIRNRAPWWAFLSLGLAACSIALALPFGLFGTALACAPGLILVVMALLDGRSVKFRADGDFDARERQNHPQFYRPLGAVDPAHPEAATYVYSPDPALVLRNARRSLLGCLLAIGLALALLTWGRSLKGELGFAGMIIVIPIYVLVLLGALLAFNAVVAFVRYLWIRPHARRVAPQAKPPEPTATGREAARAAPAKAGADAAPQRAALPGLLAGVVCLSAGMWFRSNEMVSTEIGYIIGVPLFVYGVIRCGLSLFALARSLRARRI